MAKTKVIESLCIGCGICAGVAPAVFAMNDNGLAENILGNDTELPSDLVASVEESASSCPTQAIEVS